MEDFIDIGMNRVHLTDRDRLRCFQNIAATTLTEYHALTGLWI